MATLSRSQRTDKFIKGLPLFPTDGVKPAAAPQLEVPSLFGGKSGSKAKAQAKKDFQILTEANYSSLTEFRKALDAQFYADSAVNKFADKPLIEVLPNSEQLTKQLADIRQPMRTITSEAGELADAIGASFGNAFQGLITGTTNFKNAFRTMTNSIISELMRIYVTEQIVKSIGGLFKSVFSAPLLGKAIGGPVQGGKPYIVGERGPEMFVPSRSGSIVPNNALGGGMTINVDARGASDPAAVRAQVEMGIAQAAPYIIAAAQNKTLTTAARPRLPGTLG
jgi:phage-related minor tail protein